MLGSWLGITRSHRIRGWQGVHPVSQIGVHLDQKLSLTYGPSYEGFGRRPFAGRGAWSGAGVRKPPKEETAGRKGRPFGRARPMGILGSRTARVCRRGGRWRAILAAETMMTSEFGREDARAWRGRGGRGRTDDLERTLACGNENCVRPALLSPASGQRPSFSRCSINCDGNGPRSRVAERLGQTPLASEVLTVWE